MTNSQELHLKRETFCKGCWEQMRMPIAIRGPLSYIYKPFGIHKSRMHPNLCTICESMFTRVNKRKQIEVETTILFADLRGYTHLSQHMDVSSMNRLLHRFYDSCSEAVWERDGIVNKFIGDAVLAIFNFPLVRENHSWKAVEAAMLLQKQTQHIKAAIGIEDDHDIGIGIGIHTGVCNIGEVGNSYKDFTAIGNVVNLASRLQGAARSGEILMTEEVYRQIESEFPTLNHQAFPLKGIDHDVSGFILDEKTYSTYHRPLAEKRE